MPHRDALGVGRPLVVGAIVDLVVLGRALERPLQREQRAAERVVLAPDRVANGGGYHRSERQLELGVDAHRPVTILNGTPELARAGREPARRPRTRGT